MAEDKAKVMKREDLVKSQASYKGNSQHDKVEVKIMKDGDFYKEGDVDTVHPTLAAIFEKKGLIAKGWEDNVEKYNHPKAEE